MIGLIAAIIFIFSIFGMGMVIFRKIPVLLTLPETPIEKEESLILKLKKIIERINPFKNFSLELFLEKILRKIRILTLKTDNKTFSWLRKLKEIYQKKTTTRPPPEGGSESQPSAGPQIEKNDDYWEELKKATKNK